MASSSLANMGLALLFSLSLLLPSALGAGVVCEELPQDLCAFSISSESKRCVLESAPRSGGAPTEYQCRTSEVTVGRMLDSIETNDCVGGCGVNHVKPATENGVLTVTIPKEKDDVKKP